MRATILRWTILLVAAAYAPANAVAEEISYLNDVMAVLSKAGCNQGICHGNQNGKNGFKLSLRGEDPRFDRLALSRDQANRRINLLQPERSLLLQKATAAVPHEGGRRFDVDSAEYATLRDWIAGGALADPAELPTLSAIDVEPLRAVLVDSATAAAGT